MANGKNSGLAYWLGEALRGQQAARRSADEETIHGLRVALRRCRAMARTLYEADGGGAWKKLDREARALFRSLGALRDAQVQQGWVAQFSEAGDPVGTRLAAQLEKLERRERRVAARALREFDARRWEKWLEKLPPRAEALTADPRRFAHLALARLEEVEALHHRALREDVDTRYHELRIAVKRLRYVAENFLPQQHRSGGRALKSVQDLLGESQDLAVLRAHVMALRRVDEDARARWLARIDAEQQRRLAEYRRRAAGARGVWRRWRTMLDAAA